MNKKIITGLLVLLGVVALIAVLGNSTGSQQLVKKHMKKGHKWGFNRGCPASDQYSSMCQEQGGVLCGPNSFDNMECCSTAGGKGECENKSYSFWGKTKSWKRCSSQLSLGDCP